MVSSSNDIHPTPDGTKLRDHVISSGAHGCKDGRLRGELPLSFCFSEDLSFYYHSLSTYSYRLVK